jgi:hypothetical protein
MKLEIDKWYTMGGAYYYIFDEDRESVRAYQYYVIERKIASKSRSYLGFPFEMRSANFEGISMMKPISMPKMSSLSKQQFITAIFYPYRM